MKWKIKTDPPRTTLHPPLLPACICQKQGNILGCGGGRGLRKRELFSSWSIVLPLIASSTSSERRKREFEDLIHCLVWVSFICRMLVCIHVPLVIVKKYLKKNGLVQKYMTITLRFSKVIQQYQSTSILFCPIFSKTNILLHSIESHRNGGGILNPCHSSSQNTIKGVTGMSETYT